MLVEEWNRIKREVNKTKINGTELLEMEWLFIMDDLESREKLNNKIKTIRREILLSEILLED